MKDPIVGEIHQIREQILKECNYDRKTLMEYYRKIREEEIKKGRKVASPPKRILKTSKE